MSASTELAKELNKDYHHRYWDKHSGLLMSVISGVTALGVTLVLGSYAYTWVEVKAEQEEKRIWRKEYNDELDRKFSEIKQGQKELSENVRESNTATKDMLKQILDKVNKR
jgi:hypothetical protein